MGKYFVAFILKNGRDRELSIKFGDAAPRCISSFSDEGELALREELRPIIIEELRTPSGVPCISFELEADDEKDAMRQAFRSAERLADALSLVEPTSEGISFAVHLTPMVLPNALVSDIESNPEVVDFRSYNRDSLARFNIGDNSQLVADFNELVIRHIGKLLPTNLFIPNTSLSPLEERLSDSLYWHAQSIQQRDLALSFLCLWVALEGLILRSHETSNKGRKIRSRLSQLLAYHLTEFDGEAAKKLVQDLWLLRSRIVHEGFAKSGTEALSGVTAENINNTKYFFLITLLYFLDQMGSCDDFDELWKSVASYSPSRCCCMNPKQAISRTLHFEK
jgi:hypothetical protein